MASLQLCLDGAGISLQRLCSLDRIALLSNLRQGLPRCYRIGLQPKAWIYCVLVSGYTAKTAAYPSETGLDNVGLCDRYSS